VRINRHAADRITHAIRGLLVSMALVVVTGVVMVMMLVRGCRRPGMGTRRGAATRAV
jgi:hypothetical protein